MALTSAQQKQFSLHRRRALPGWLLIGGLVWFLLTLFHQRKFDSATPVSRLCLILAICLEGRLEIDSFHSKTPDKAVVNGHYYSDKAPGTVALALIGAAPAVWISQSIGISPEDSRLWLVASWAGCAVLNLVVSVGFVCLGLLLRDIITADRTSWPNSFSQQTVPSNRAFSPTTVALLTTFFIFFGGMPWPYATMMFSHAQTIGCVCIGLWFLHRFDPSLFNLSSSSKAVSLLPINGQLGSTRRLLFLAGFAFGWALNSEYTTGLIVLGIPLVTFWVRRGKSLGVSVNYSINFLLGISLPCLLIPLYSWATIGSPWQLPYSYQAAFPEMQQGLYAIKWPNPTIAFNLLFSPQRGLFFWSPFLLLACFGAVMVVSNVRLFLISYAIPLLHIVVISGREWDWPAGPSFSARYLAPMLPLLAISCLSALRRYPYLSGALGLLSVLMTGLATVTNAVSDFRTHSNPLLTLHLPLALGFDFNPNLLSALSGVGGVWILLAIPVIFLICRKRAS